jgi:peptidoglycan/LPS O-acetylase OafA/YrhL
MTEASSPSRSIPSLDGLRALSVLFVILGHTDTPLFVRWRNVLFPFQYGGMGVMIFFVISGFLITHLLLKEQQATGTVNLKNFYIRRTLRIFPPFYAYVAVVAILTAFNVYQVSAGAFASAMTYTWNYNSHGGLWILGHTWFLSLEEQFYLLWPACVAYFLPRTNLRIAIALIIVSPIVRVIGSVWFLWYRANATWFIPTAMDIFMFGASIALAIRLNIHKRIFSAVAKPHYMALAWVFILIVDHLLMNRFRNAYLYSLAYPLDGIAISIILIYSVTKPDSPFGRFLNLRFMRHLGGIASIFGNRYSEEGIHVGSH